MAVPTGCGFRPGAGSGESALPPSYKAGQRPYRSLRRDNPAPQDHGDRLSNNWVLGFDSALEPLRGSVQLVDNLYQTMIDTLPLSDKLTTV